MFAFREDSLVSLGLDDSFYGGDGNGNGYGNGVSSDSNGSGGGKW